MNAETAAKVILNRHIEKRKELAGLDMLKDVLCECVPAGIIRKVAGIITEFSLYNKTINIDGFVNFRLYSVKEEIDDYVKSAINMIIQRNRHYKVLYFPIHSIPDKPV